MTNKLYICEKPSQARDIARVLGASKRADGFIEGEGVIVTWCLGHLLELAPPESYCEQLKPWRMAVLPVIPKIWQVIPTKRGKKQFSIIKKLLKKSSHVVIATDADREGDVIGREILELCRFRGKVERLWLCALDDTSIKKALSEIRPGAATENLYQAGLGRQRADWLIGMNLTMAVSALYGIPGQGALSVGRVQTPTLKLVVDRDALIDNFKLSDYFVLMGEFENKEGVRFKAKWMVPEEEGDAEGRCLKRAVCEAVAKKTKGTKGVVTNFSETKKRKKAPLCLSLSSLQKLSSSQLGLSVKETLDIAQSLYEKHKATTYPRSDCGYLPQSQFSEAKIILQNMGNIDATLQPLINRCDSTIQSSVWNDKKITAHHAIIPTANKAVNIKTMSASELAVYRLICSYYIAQFLGEYEYAERCVELECEGEHFKASHNTPLKEGWRAAIKKTKHEDKDRSIQEDGLDNLIPLLKKEEGIINQGCDIQPKQTQSPSRFTEGTLIGAMKSIANTIDDTHLRKILKGSAGIGTEATRANILETLFMRKYLTHKGKKVISTKKGRALIMILPDILKSPMTTAKWEEKLDEIAAGEGDLEYFLDDQVDVLEGILETLAEQKEKRELENPLAIDIPTAPCPLCKKPMYQLKSKKGKSYWRCSDVLSCKISSPDNNGKPGTPFPKELEPVVE